MRTTARPKAAPSGTLRVRGGTPALGAFAVVMATGILSIDAQDEGLADASRALLGIAVVLYAVLGVRALARPAAVRSELDDPAGALGAFAVVAATEVLAARSGRAPVELAGLAVGGAAWACIAAATLVALRRAERRGIAWTGRLRGASLLVAVASESLAIVAGDLSRAHGAGLAWLAVGLWLLGLACYLLVAPTGARAARSRWGQRGLAGDHWIFMGALAIATVAAARLASAWPHAPLADAALCLWLATTAWLPLLVFAEVTPRGGLRYRFQRFATVFPLGMYALACHDVARLERWPALTTVSAAPFAAGALVWALTVAGALRRAAPTPTARTPGS